MDTKEEKEIHDLQKLLKKEFLKKTKEILENFVGDTEYPIIDYSEIVVDTKVADDGCGLEISVSING